MGRGGGLGEASAEGLGKLQAAWIEREVRG